MFRVSSNCDETYWFGVPVPRRLVKKGNGLIGFNKRGWRCSYDAMVGQYRIPSHGTSVRLAAYQYGEQNWIIIIIIKRHRENY